MSLINSNSFLYKTVDGVKQFFSPLVNASTVVLEDGSKLEAGGKIHVNTADDAEKLGGKASAYYTLYTNLADNSDFTKWVAKAGIGSTHGTETYGGDRWILINGTITGEENADGDGYRNITLNGTLVQVVSSPPAVATSFVEMISGTAEISYDASKGEIIITSAGGVIKNVLLLEGEWVEKPEYVSKGYAAELLDSNRYFLPITNDPIGSGYLGGNTGDIAYVSISIPTKMRVDPTFVYVGTGQLSVRANGANVQKSITEYNIRVYSHTESSIGIRIEYATGLSSKYTCSAFCGNTLKLYLVADLARR